jgi:hypothetical protein
MDYLLEKIQYRYAYICSDSDCDIVGMNSKTGAVKVDLQNAHPVVDNVMEKLRVQIKLYQNKYAADNNFVPSSDAFYLTMMYYKFLLDLYRNIMYRYDTNNKRQLSDKLSSYIDEITNALTDEAFQSTYVHYNQYHQMVRKIT